MLTGRTIVTRDTEWDDYTRDRALALTVWEAGRCPSCGNYDTLVPLPLATRHVFWAEHDNRNIEVTQMRCVTCGAMDILRRDFNAKHEKDKAMPGTAIAADGHMFSARPLPKE